MPSPFPGMDPYIEGYEWDDFHGRMITAMSDALVPRIRPRYAVRTERRVYLEHDVDDPKFIRPDLTILSDEERGLLPDGSSAASVTVAEPVQCTLPMPEEIRERYLVVRRMDSGEVVTVIELLSPRNKRSGSDGRKAYLAKRQEVLQSRTSLVEIDLLRGGERLPTIEPLPKGDYYVFVCRAKRRPRADVYAWQVARPLPAIPVPLADGDPDVSLDLQQVFAEVFDRAGYDYSLDHQHPVTPAADESMMQWIREIFASQTQ